MNISEIRRHCETEIIISDPSTGKERRATSFNEPLFYEMCKEAAFENECGMPDCALI